jgi:hypothetical protein
MLDPKSFFGKDTREYIKESALDEKSIGRVVEYDDDGEYTIRWINKFNTILDKSTDSKLLFKSGNFIFLKARDVDKDIQHRLWFEKPLKLPDVEPVNAPNQELADLFGAMTFNNPPHPPPPPPPQSLAEILPKITNLDTPSPQPPPPPTRKGGKKSRKNRNSVKGGKSRKLYKKFCKSRKLRKSRNVRKTRRR